MLRISKEPEYLKSKIVLGLDEVREASFNAGETIEVTKEEIGKVNDELMTFISIIAPEQAAAYEAILAQRLKINDAENEARNIQEEYKKKINDVMINEKLTLEERFKAKKRLEEESLKATFDRVESEKIKLKELEEAYRIKFTDRQKVIRELTDFTNAAVELMINKEKEYQMSIASTTDLLTARERSLQAFKGLFTGETPIFNTKKGGDFIITKRGEFIETSPDDTIIATKNGVGRNSIYVSIENIYGVDADNIAEALHDKLFTLIQT